MLSEVQVVYSLNVIGGGRKREVAHSGNRDKAKRNAVCYFSMEAFAPTEELPSCSKSSIHFCTVACKEASDLVS